MNHMDLEKIKTGSESCDEVNVFVEIPQGSAIKYELDKESGAIMVDRFLHTAMSYPFNYGFVPGTHAKDGDPVDILVLSSLPVMPGAIMKARPVGMLEMEDEAGEDNKIIAVPADKTDPHFAHITDIGDVQEAIKRKVKHFFETYKELEDGKWVKVRNFLGAEAAKEEIRRARLPAGRKAPASA